MLAALAVGAPGWGVEAGAGDAGPGAGAHNSSGAIGGGEARLALVMGNNGYTREAALINPINDARAMAATLKELNFTVLEGYDLDQDAMEALLLEFGRRAASFDVAVAFFAGHGIQVDGVNYLLPIDARVDGEQALRRLYTLTQDAVVAELAQAQRLGVLILDACRNNPFVATLQRSLKARRSRSGTARGLAAVGERLPSGLIVAYATEPGAVADDGDTQHSPYTRSLLEHLSTPGLDVRLMFAKAGQTTASLTNGFQKPIYEDQSYGYEFCFAGCRVLQTVDVEQLLQECHNHQQSHRLLEAGQCYREVLRHRRGHPTALAELASVERGLLASVVGYLESQEPARARRALGALEQLNPLHPRLADLEEHYREIRDTLAPATVDPKTVDQALVAQQLRLVESHLQTLDTRGARQALATLRALDDDLPQIAQFEAKLQLITPGFVFRDQLPEGAQGPAMVVVPAGVFTMGSEPDESGRQAHEVPHRATVQRPFAAAVTEVQRRQFARFAAATGYRTDAERQRSFAGCFHFDLKSGEWLMEKTLTWRTVLPRDRDDLPVTCVSLDDARAYARWLSTQTQHRYRLPTEVEWEYLARANATTPHPWANPTEACAFENGPDRALQRRWPELRGELLNCDDGFATLAPGGSRRPNGFGLQDLLGNASEWTCSLYDPEYRGDQSRCGDYATDDPRFAVRGATWYEAPSALRVAHRSQALPPLLRHSALGFRLVREIQSIDHHQTSLVAVGEDPREP
ncbi:MAG: SUMF1/EgtB/PvdO family nonheme iron enzyme [Candidatus Competibacterales bacterium]